MANPSTLSNWTRGRDGGRSETGVDIALAVLLHASVAAALVLYGLLAHARGKTWGDQAATVGSIQATMVSALPLPPRRPVVEDKVLATETPSPAPVVAKEATVPKPSPKDIPIPVKQPPKPTKPLKVAEKPTPPPPKHAELKPPPPTKATTGEASGMRIAQATMQLKNGTASASVQDRSFGARFAYYVEAVNRRVSQNWFTQEADPRASEGRRATILFDIDREGTPSNIRMLSRSGSPSLDTSALRAVQRVDGFGALPQGDHITVEFSFDYRRQQ